MDALDIPTMITLKKNKKMRAKIASRNLFVLNREKATDPMIPKVKNSNSGCLVSNIFKPKNNKPIIKEQIVPKPIIKAIYLICSFLLTLTSTTYFNLFKD